MANDLSNKYFVRKKATDNWIDVTTLFDGIKILAISGFNDEGDATNVFTQQWVDSQAEDYLCTMQDNQGNDVIIRQNIDLSLTFIAGTKYSINKDVDTQTVYDTFKNYCTKQGDFYVKSAYTNKSAHVVCLKSFKPTTEKLNRGINSYILCTIPLHTLDAPTT